MEGNNKKVLCAGLSCLDIVMLCEKYPEEDSDQRCLSYEWKRGGNASNDCSVFAEFEVPCEILATMSTDLSGKFMLDDFKKWGIVTENCHMYEEYESPVSTVLINSKNGSRTIVHFNKNLPELCLKDFEKLDLTQYLWIHFECRPQVGDIKLMIEHFNLWREKNNKNIKVSLEIEKPRKECMELLSLPDVIFISKDFAMACGFPDMESAVNGLCNKLNSNAVLICAWGDKGACAKTANGPIIKSHAYSPDNLVDTLSAGDTFVAAVIIEFLAGKNLTEAVSTGCRIAGTKCGMNGIKGLSKLFPLKI